MLQIIYINIRQTNIQTVVNQLFKLFNFQIVGHKCFINVCNAIIIVI